jgi:hypothetical protein
MMYEQTVRQEVEEWQKKMSRPPSFVNRLSKSIQGRVNRIIPEKVHKALTTAITGMVKSVLFGAKYTTAAPRSFSSLEALETAVYKRIQFYTNTAAVEGGITGAGGFLLGLAEFPVLISIKIKLLFDIAALYGYSVKDYRERLYILHIFQAAFSTQEHRINVYNQMVDWDNKKEALPNEVEEFDWRSFQQEYRDYIDLAKLAQLIPGIGAVVGFVVNKRLLKKLGETAMNAYRMRWLKNQALAGKMIGNDDG